jgi:hypothetical protein
MSRGQTLVLRAELFTAILGIKKTKSALLRF